MSINKFSAAVSSSESRSRSVKVDADGLRGEHSNLFRYTSFGEGLLLFVDLAFGSGATSATDNICCEGDASRGRLNEAMLPGMQQVVAFFYSAK